MEAMVINELPPLEKQLRSEELIDREVAATRLAQAGHDGVRMLAAIAIDTNASPASRLTALRHLPADAGRVRRDVDESDRTDPTAAGEDPLPGRARAHSQGRHQADAGHRHAAARRVRRVRGTQDAPVVPWCASM